MKYYLCWIYIKPMSSEIKSIAKNALLIETKAVAGLEKFIDDQFVAAVQAVIQSKGRLIVSGIGKSAIIAQKIVATCNSTGTHAMYLHAADAIHGDSGMIGPEDVVMIISKSGDYKIKLNAWISLCPSQMMAMKSIKLRSLRVMVAIMRTW